MATITLHYDARNSIAPKNDKIYFIVGCIYCNSAKEKIKF